MRPIITTALFTGLRRGEILQLPWDNIDFTNNIIIIPPSKNKSKKKKTVPLSSILRNLLLELKLKNSSLSEYVFLDDKGNNIKDIKTAFNNACKRSEIKEFVFHDLEAYSRHWNVRMWCWYSRDKRDIRTFENRINQEKIFTS